MKKYLLVQNEVTLAHTVGGTCIEDALLETIAKRQFRNLWHDCMLPKGHSGPHKCPCGLIWPPSEERLRLD